jgi:hypothetical protein
MATSGTTSFTTTRNEIIKHAARLCGALRQGESLGAAKFAEFDYMLNAMVKHWEGDGLHVWTVAEGVLIPQSNQSSYMTSVSTDRFALDSDFFVFEMADDAASGATALLIDDTTNVAVSDKVGVVLDDGSVHWSTLASKTSDTLTIADAITDDVSAGAPVMSYTNALAAPIRVTDARLYNLTSGAVTPVDTEARLGFRRLSQPNASGRISQIFYDKQAQYGKMQVWQVPDVIDDVVKFTHWRPIETFESAGDNPDLPEQWTLCLGFNLAKLMAVEYGLGEKRYAMIVAQADKLLDDAKGFSREVESVHFGVDMRE